jgi:hypothetical protein
MHGFVDRGVSGENALFWPESELGRASRVAMKVESGRIRPETDFA